MAVVFDALAVLILGYVGFKAGTVLAPCSDLGECFVLTPLVVIAALVLIAAYFLAGYVLWRRTPGERVFLRPAPERP